MSAISDEIEKEVTAQLGVFLSDKAVLTTLLQVFSSLRVRKAANTLHKTQSSLISLGSRLVGKEKTLIDAVAYQFWVEVNTNLITDIVIIMLSAKGQYFHIEPDDSYRFIRHATTIEDLESPAVSLATKISFLGKNKISCFDKYVDKRLRNKIAHADFEIDDAGNFYVYVRKNGEFTRKKVDIQRKLYLLNCLNSTVMHHIKLAMNKTKPSLDKI